MSSLLVPGDSCRTGTLIHIATVETPRREAGRQRTLISVVAKRKPEECVCLYIMFP